MREPAIKRTWACVDGQNLFHAVKHAFGYTYPNYDVGKLALSLCEAQGWNLARTSFYTGVPDATDNPTWNRFWSNKLLQMSRQGIQTFSRPLRYRNQTISLPDGTQHTMLVGQEVSQTTAIYGLDIALAGVFVV